MSCPERFKPSEAVRSLGQQQLAGSSDLERVKLPFGVTVRPGRCGERQHLQASFGLEAPGLQRVGALVHYLDVGGAQPTEATGVERVLAGLRASIENDDQLLAAACAIFDGLLAAFGKEGQSDE